ncbi:hypothetical protein [Corynebacterium aquilae]|uniref:Uncharacterized protein n=1 Tax=Corynebacterium aquilae DSM 44791 TaxID=1431546 RepID=A0A1L7CHN0_9CORY|nr:hypothetical protein [Corynebacterium aquilae]APT85319.1 hypothetical protein CAQU_09855 [Corynebacterium aquilae DSM 44791]
MATKANETNVPGAIDLNALLAKREEELGIRDTIPVKVGAETFNITHPAYQGAEWNDRMKQLSDDSAEGIITQSEYRDEYLEMVFGEQAEAFVEAAAKITPIDPLTLAVILIEEETKRQGKIQSRKRSPGGRKR